MVLLTQATVHIKSILSLFSFLSPPSVFIPPPLCLSLSLSLPPQIVDAGHFWAQFSDTQTHYQLRDLMTSISERALSPLVADFNKLPGTFCLAKYSEDGQYYRARIENYSKFTERVQVSIVAAVLLSS